MPSNNKSQSDIDSKINYIKNSSKANQGHHAKKQWYKKKSTIIASSSILGVGALVTAITVPIVLVNEQKNSSVAVTSVDLKNAVTAINVESNKNTRIDIWNKYMDSLSTSIPGQTETHLNQFIRSKSFIDEFINFLTTNLIVSTTPSIGSILPNDLETFRNKLILHKADFSDSTKTIYSNDFLKFSSTNVMFIFKDSPTTPTIQFELLMPSISWDLIYSEFRNVPIKIKTLANANSVNKVRIRFTKFDNTNLAGNTYFFNDKIFDFPSQITKKFINFLDQEIQLEAQNRNRLNANFAAIKNSIDQDKSFTTALSYWNSFALNHAVSNKSFLENDFSKDIASSGILTFLKDNSAITTSELNEIRNFAIADFNVSDTPYVTSSAYSNILFKSVKPLANNYQIELKIYNFSFDYQISNLFAGANAIAMQPKLEMDGLITKTTQHDATTAFPISKKLYDVNKIINMSLDTLPATGGFLGFFYGLIFSSNLPIPILTNSIVSFNNRPIADKITFWNEFTRNSNLALFSEFKATNILWDFIFNNIDLSNVITPNHSKPFPITNTNVDFVKNNFNTTATSIPRINLELNHNSVAPIWPIGTDFPLFYFQYGSVIGESLVMNLYFGSELTSIKNMNIVSTNSTSTLTIEQELGPSLSGVGGSHPQAVAAASKRIAAHFYAGNGDSWVFYLGEYKTTNPVGKISKPIVVPSTILTSPTNFVYSLNSFITSSKK